MAADQAADATLVAEEPRRAAVHNAEVKGLLEERLVVAQKLAELIREQNDLGQLPLVDVVDAERQVLDAELDLAETLEDRVAAFEKFVAVTEQAERVVEARVETGHASTDAPLQAKLARLKARIELERARSGQIP